MMPVTLRLAGAFLIGCEAFPAAAAEPQYVVISFDSANDITQWERSRALARETGASFTYFLSCVYLLSPQTRDAYASPVAGKRSNIGFATSRDDVAQRLRQIWTARMEGHEIASHGCGHFDGASWNKATWLAEFDQFAAVLRDAWRVNGIPYEPDGWRRFAASEITGFRAPYLATSDTLFAALGEHGFHYDASGVSRGPEAPAQSHGVTRYALPMVPEGPRSRPVIAMDYNLYVRHSGGEERPAEADVFVERAYRAFADALEKERSGARHPLQIGFHFTQMNDGAYWRALERFAGEACALPDVRCVSYAKLEEILHPSHTAAIDED